MKVFLIGYMGVGKTTVGKKLASYLGIPFVDLDRQIEISESMPIPEIFSKKGEIYFREKEAITLRHLSNESGDAVISTGGGTPCYSDNMDLMRSHGITVWLSLPAKMIARRLESAKSVRPIIANITPKDLPEFIESHLAERVPFYERAHITFSAQDISSEKLKALAYEISAWE